MNQREYSFSEAAKDILEKLHNKGWNAYNSTKSQVLGTKETIKSGPAQVLEVGQRYVVLPLVDSPENPHLVMEALERLAIKLNRETPTILINGQRHHWTGFIPQVADIKVNTTKGHYLIYQDFISSLDSIVKTN